MCYYAQFHNVHLPGDFVCVYMEWGNEEKAYIL